MSTINFQELKILGLLKYRPKSFGILQTYCKIHAISFLEHAKVLYIYLKNAQIILRIFGHI
jgi:hypothetical protein